ncbi:MAG: endonuclease V [Trueperaceae bacterium]
MAQPFQIPKTIHEATKLQKTLRDKVILEGELSDIRTFAALDASHPTRFSKVKGFSVAAVVVWDKDKNVMLETATASVNETTLFPYVPGFLSFRESPSYIAALANLSHQPDLLLVDGQGIAHPRGLGIASHLGVHLDIPSIGIAKTLLFGKPEKDLGESAGSAVRLMNKTHQVGWVLRSKINVKPLYVSPGHNVSMEGALEFALSLLGKNRLPEPLGQAHRVAGEARRHST